MESNRTRGIVLRQSGHGESDKIITFYSPTLGKITGIAKGAKRSKKRFVNKLELFTLLDISYIPPRAGGLFFLSQAELLHPFLSLRTRHSRYVMAALACELTLKFTSEHDPDPQIFALLSWLLESVDQGVKPLKTGALFHLRLLGTCGYQPQLYQCSHCHHPVNDNRSFSLQPANGSLVCHHCNPGALRSPFSLSLQTIKFLQTGQQLKIDQLHRLQMPEKAAVETLLILHRYSRHLLQRDIQSWQFVHKSFQPT